jgi:hypothetical protein
MKRATSQEVTANKKLKMDLDSSELAKKIKEKQAEIARLNSSSGLSDLQAKIQKAKQAAAERLAQAQAEKVALYYV